MSRFLLIICVVFLPLLVQANLKDSLRLEKINGKKFIVHRVDPKETLYSISKRYGSNIDEIYKYNESLEQGLKMYDEIIIPYQKRRKKSASKSTIKSNETDFHVVQAGETLYAISRKYSLSIDSLKSFNNLSSNNIGLGDTLLLNGNTLISSKEVIQKNRDRDSTIYHVVEPSETLFGIARKYDVSLADLLRWNNLDSYDVSVGQRIAIGVSIIDLKEDEKEESSSSTDSIPQVVPLDTTYVKTDNSLFKTQTVEVEGVKTVIEQGFAMRIEDTDFTTKLLALHKTAPMGSLVKVTNRMTNKVIEVRVVGELPETGMNRNVLLRLSSAAYKELGARDQKIPITSSYPKEGP